MATDLTQSIPARLETLFGITEPLPEIDTSDLDGSPSNAELEAAVLAILDVLEDRGIVTLDDGE